MALHAVHNVWRKPCLSYGLRSYTLRCRAHRRQTLQGEQPPTTTSSRTTPGATRSLHSSCNTATSSGSSAAVAAPAAAGPLPVALQRQSAELCSAVTGAPASLAVLALLVATLAEPAGAASAAAGDVVPHNTLLDLAEGEEFWGNVAKYARYFVTVMLGTGYVMVQPLLSAFKRPVTAAAAIVAVVGGAVLVKFTLSAMLGLQEPFAYEPGSIVPYD